MPRSKLFTARLNRERHHQRMRSLDEFEEFCHAQKTRLEEELRVWSLARHQRLTTFATRADLDLTTKGPAIGASGAKKPRAA